MSETAVSDTGPPLHLAEVDREATLSLFKWVAVTGQVATELARHGVRDRVWMALGERLVERTVTDQEMGAQQATLGEPALSPTDLSVAALAAWLSPDVVLTDDLSLRRALETHGITVAGSVGVLIRAFRLGLLSRGELEASLDCLLDGSTLYLSRGFRAHVRRLLGAL